MNLHISGQNISVTDALRHHAQKKFEKIKKHFDHFIETHINIKTDKGHAFAEAKVHVRGHTFFATADHQDMYISIDSLAMKLDRQIIKHKEKIQDHHGPQHHGLDYTK